jgi:hypothetical protein
MEGDCRVNEERKASMERTSGAKRDSAGRTLHEARLPERVERRPKV